MSRRNSDDSSTDHHHHHHHHLFAQNTIKTRKIDSIDEQDNKVLCCTLTAAQNSINDTNQLIKTTFKKISKIDTFSCPSKLTRDKKSTVRGKLYKVKEFHMFTTLSVKKILRAVGLLTNVLGRREPEDGERKRNSQTRILSKTTDDSYWNIADSYTHYQAHIRANKDSM